MRSKSAEKIKLTTYDELFGTEENNVEGTYTTVPLSQLRPLKIIPLRYWMMKKCRRQWRV